MRTSTLGHRRHTGARPGARRRPPISAATLHAAGLTAGRCRWCVPLLLTLVLLATTAVPALAQATAPGTISFPVFDQAFRRLPTLPAQILNVVLDPTTDRTLYLVGSVVTRGPVVFRSADGGVTWEERGQPLVSSAPALRLSVSPWDPRVLVAAIAGERSHPAQLGISGDAGATWRPLLVTGVAASDGLADPAARDAVLAIVPDQGVVRLTYDLSRPDQVLRDQQALPVPADLRAAVSRLAADYRQRLIFAAAGTTVLRSADGGQTWAQAVLDLPAPAAISALAVHPTDGSLVAAVHLGGAYPANRTAIYRSTDRGATWRSAFVPTTPLPPLTVLRFSPGGTHLVAAGTTFGEGVTSVLLTARGDATGWTPRLAASEPGYLPGNVGGLPAAAVRDDGAVLAGTLRTGAYLTDPRVPVPAARVGPPAGPNPAVTYFPETGHTLAYGFKHYWEAHGGLAVFGYPITEEFDERSEEDGRVYTVQYFERARFEYHLEHAGTPFETLLGLLGKQAAPVPTAGDAFWVVSPFPDTPERRYFPQTSHALAYGFKRYWEAHGGLAIFGLPISEEFREVTPIDGREYTVQYFERARFEYHPEHAGTPYEVLLGLLGTQVARQQRLLQ